MVLAVVGLYGVVSYSVSQRRREMGVRLALGAEGRAINGMIMKQSLTFVAIGLFVGVIGGLALTRLMEGLLFGVSASDPWTYGVVAVTLTAVAADPVIRSTHPALARAVESISSPAIRNMATLGGNLCLDTRCTYYNQNEEWRESIDFCMKEGGTVCWVAPQSDRCWAISSSDAAPMLCALGASVRLMSARGARELLLADLYREDGIDYLTKQPDEVLTEIVIPAPGELESSFWKLRRRVSIDFPVLKERSRRRTSGSVRSLLLRSDPMRPPKC